MATTRRRATSLPDQSQPPDSSSDSISISIHDPASQLQSGSSWLLALFNLTNTAIGAGTLALPFTMHQCGLLMGVIALLMMAACTWTGLFFITVSARVYRQKSFLRIARASMGPRGEQLASLAMFLLLMGPLSAYFNITGSFVHEVLEVCLPGVDPHAWYISQVFVMTLVGIFVMLPLSMVPSLRMLAYASFLALFSMFYAIILIPLLFLQATQDPEWKQPPIHPWVRPSWSILSGFCTIGMAYTNHVNVAEILADMSRPTMKRQHSLTMTSSSIITLVYLVVGMTGYLMFGDKIQGNVLDGAENTAAVLVGKILVALGVALTYPLLVRPARECLDRFVGTMKKVSISGNVDTVLGAGKSHESDIADLSASALVPESTEDLSPQSTISPKLLSKLETLAIVLVSYGIAVAIPNLDMIFALFGALTGSLIMFILPSCFYVLSMQRCGFLRIRGIIVQPVGVGIFGLRDQSQTAYGAIATDDSDRLLSPSTVRSSTMEIDDSQVISPPVSDAYHFNPMEVADDERIHPPTSLSLFMVYFNCFVGFILLIVGTVYALIDLFIDND